VLDAPRPVESRDHARRQDTAILALPRFSKKLGEGRHGEVWSARDERPRAATSPLSASSGRVRRDAETRERFWREARPGGRQSSHVCQIYEVGEEGDELFPRWSCCRVESLEKRFARGPLEFGEARAPGSRFSRARSGFTGRDSSTAT